MEIEKGEKRMRTARKRMSIALAAATVLVVLCSAATAAEGPPLEGGVLPDISFPVPEKKEDQHYLGVGGQGTFKIPRLNASVVIIEIFSMYCPYCQKEAPAVNELYQLIEKDSKLRPKIKMVGVGAGNSAFEVDLFRTNYAVPFPLIADASFAAHNALGKVRTPYFLVIKINKNGTHKVIYSRVGSFGEPGKFLQTIIKDAGLGKGV
jgi:thiol-disulfide isomerase/thioredoxin